MNKISMDTDNSATPPSHLKSTYNSTSSPISLTPPAIISYTEPIPLLTAATGSTSLPTRPASSGVSSFSVFVAPGQVNKWACSKQLLEDKVVISPESNPFLSSIREFLIRSHTVTDDYAAIASLAARVWIDQLNQSKLISEPLGPLTLPSHPVSFDLLSSARQAAIHKENEATLPPAELHFSNVQTIHGSDMGRRRNKDTSNLGQPFSSSRALASDPQAMMAASPHSIQWHQGPHLPHPRTGRREAALYTKCWTNLQATWRDFSLSGRTVPLPPPLPVIDSDIPENLSNLYDEYCQSKGKSSSTKPHHRLHPLAIIQCHLDTSIGPCHHCDSGVCSIIQRASLADGAPTPFVKDWRPLPDSKISMYPLSDADWRVAMAEIVGYWKKGVLRRAPNAPTLEHPYFVVMKYRMAPQADLLDSLYKLFPGALASQLLATASSVIDNAMQLQFQSSTTTDSSTMDLSALNLALRPFLTDAKPRLVIDYGRKDFNEACADWLFSYISIARLLGLISWGSWVASFDISAAFVLLPTHPVDQELLCIRLPASGALQDGRLKKGDHWIVLQQMRHLFGTKFLPAQFSTLSAEFVDTLRRRFDKYGADGFTTFQAYMDDIFVISSSRPLCEKACIDLQEYMAAIGAELNDKTRQPAQKNIPLLGVEVDTLAMTVSLPLAKAYSTAFLCSLVLDMITRKVTPPENLLAKLLGKLEHASYATSGGAGRLARIRHAILAARPSSDNTSPINPLSVSSQFQDGLLWWLHALSDSPPTARLFTSCSASSPGSEFRFKSDAAGKIGAGLLCSDVVLHLSWTEDMAKSESIQLKELMPIVLFIERYGFLLRGLSLAFGTDNLPNVYGINKKTMRDPVALEWLVYLCDLTDHHHILLLPSWSPRENNTEADVLSKSGSAMEVAALYPTYKQTL
jgi:hypothetical protein